MLTESEIAHVAFTNVTDALMYAQRLTSAEGQEFNRLIQLAYEYAQDIMGLDL